MQKVRCHFLKAPTVCKHQFQDSISNLQVSISPFPYGTCSLSVIKKYLGLEGGPPIFKQDFTCLDLLMLIYQNLKTYRTFTFFG